ncbi:fungal-specific transcription factor domain-containing protein, partial [Flammula alnicola]
MAMHVEYRPVKTEGSSSPDLSPSLPSAFQFKFHASHGPLSHSPLYRFGSDFDSPHWPPHSTAAVVSHLPPRVNSAIINENGRGATHFYLDDPQRAMSYSDEYDDLAEIPSDQALASYPGSTANAANDRTVRRRSSKACDQCRKSKCKCERTGPSEPCKNCIMLGTPCTFLGPSRKRGPPKGYIDAIEARLHQTEALLGIMLATSDARAQSLLRDIGKDPLAKEIITRVDNSPYGVKGRKREDIALSVGGKLRSAQSSETSLPGGQKEKTETDKVDLTSTHPSNEWQDRVSTMLNAAAAAASSTSAGPQQATSASPSAAAPVPATDRRPDNNNNNSGTSNLNNTPRDVDRHPYSPTSQPSSDGNQSPGGRRQRRRVGDEDYSPAFQPGMGLYAAHSAPGSAVSLQQQTAYGVSGSPVRGRFGQGGRRGSGGVGVGVGGSNNVGGALGRLGRGGGRDRRSSSVDGDSMTSESEEEFTGAMGQLSLNEDEQVRYHGKASGLYLLGNKERVDRRNEGGIWRFPKARVWPPLPSGSRSVNRMGEDETSLEMEFVSQLPAPQVQEHLLDLYFTYVQPLFPIVHKQSFWESYKAGTYADSPHSPDDADPPNSASPFSRRRRRVPPLLLLSMYALASRYDTLTTPPPSDPAMMWSAGDEYLDSAKILLDTSYASSRPATVQALLLLGYREIGIGAMAQAWTYIGMGIRMAQDLGMHRSAEGWERAGLGGRIFGERELGERRRVWFGCVIMDKYVSTYIGRPLMIFEWDFDTPLPKEDDPEEFEEWSLETPPHGDRSPGVPGRSISCFNASATL